MWKGAYREAICLSLDVLFAPVLSLHIRTRAHVATESAAVQSIADVYGVNGSTVENRDSSNGDCVRVRGRPFQHI